MSQRDYYEVLGVAKTATAEDLKKAYRRCAMRHHPDRNPGDKEAEARFKECQQAYGVLSDPAKRSLYDRLGHAAFAQGGAGSSGPSGGFGGPGMDDVDLSAVFGDLFGSIFGSGSRQNARGGDVLTSITLTLEECAQGVETTVELPMTMPCDACQASGSTDGVMTACATCQGRGKIRSQGGIFSIERPCGSCRGAGQVPANPCPQCQGAGLQKKKRKLSVAVPAGVDEGDRIRLAGQGEHGPAGVPPGDLYVQVQVAPHPIFQRAGADLHCEVPLRVSQAALGTTVQVPVLGGDPLEIKIPPGTQSGKIFRVRGRGVTPVRASRAGDLYCNIVVETPVNLTAEQRDLLEKLEATMQGDSAQRHSPRTSTFVDNLKGLWGRIRA